MADATGVECTVSVGGVVVPANVNGTSPSVSRAMRPIVLALGLANNLVGYAPSTGAKSGFQVSFDVPYGASISAMAGATPLTVAMQFGDAGGVSVANCIATSFVVTGSEGQNISVNATYESKSLPTVGATVAAPGGSTDVYKFSDVVSITLVSGAVATDVNSFTFSVTRTLARYVGNSPTGIPKRIRGTHVEASLTAEYVKLDDAEETAFIGDGTPNYCPTIGDMVVSITGICGGSGDLTLTAADCFYQDWPQSVGGTEDFVRERVMGQAQKGAYTIA